MRIHFLPLALGLAVLAGCASPDGETLAEKQAFTLKKRDVAMAELAVRDPAARAKTEVAIGYLFMSCFSIHPGFGTFANGYGVIHNNRTGRETFIRMTRFGLGPGLAVKGYYVVATLDNLEDVEALEQGTWYVGAFAEASFRFGGTGGSAIGETVRGQNEVWVWTHTGVSLELAAGGGKYYLDDSMN